MPEIDIQDTEILEAERLIIQDDPLFLVKGHFLTIKTKAGELAKLELNEIQLKILSKIEECIAKRKPVRLWVLKARQAGVSTLSEAVLYAFTSQKAATNSLVIADDIDGSNYIFSMQKLFQESLEDHVKPDVRHSNEKKLEFDGLQSQILIDTADNLKAGRKYTFRLVHLSECAFFKDLRGLMLGLNQAVPNLPGTIVIGETTANGIGNQFYDEWISCINGQSDWETIFIPWFEIKEYSISLEDGKMYPIDSIDFPSASDKDKFIFDEQILKKKYNLKDEQINWRRWCIVNNCNRNVLLFNQEYPDSWETAFISTGDLFFDKEMLKRQEVIKPIASGNIVEENHKFLFRETQSGIFKIYDMPDKLTDYMIGADPAEGNEFGDYSSAVVIDKKTNATVASYKHTSSPDRFATDLMNLGHFYNNAMITCENKGYGYSVNQDIYNSYGNIYKKIRTKKGFKERTLELGWNTNSVSRPTMLAQLKEEIENSSTELRDKDLVQECWTFINNLKRGQPEAEKGKNDDLVMARAIAGMARNENPYRGNRPTLKKIRHRKGLSGY